ncbi:porin [Marinilongibacter aquaticus]|uniref:porin n=1 Tax=Marinilongibacter aquaticus TaxID=2975157 RepID=UPI0021BDA544|nr:porin [Marinilongibacter aquaticus]UBM58881.1 porin [Marinilongibacter aquaticus]
MKKIYLAILSVVAFFSAEAQESSSPLSLSGYVDTYYFANTNGVTSNLGASGFERIFDQKANNFQVGLAQLKTTYEAGSVTGVIDLTFGNHGDLGNYGNTQSPLGAGIGTTGLAIKQAYMAWAMNDKVTFTAGQYGTHVGYEVIDAPVNFNYSLSNLFGNGPFYHTGIKMDVAVSDGFAFMVGVNNGLDSKDDNNKPKGLAAQVYLAPVDGWDLYLNYYGTNEGTKDDPFTYTWFDITTTYQATDNFLIGLNAVPYGGLKTGGDTKSWWGAALYLDASLTEKFGLGLRAEHFDNSNGGIYLIDTNGDGTAVTSLTLTGSVDITKNLIFKPEVRFDTYSPTSGYQLMDSDGLYNKNNQTTVGAAMIFHF